MTTTIKITELENIGASLASSTLIPVVNMSGTPTTEKAVLGNIANVILAGAGTTYVGVGAATLAGTVTTAAQPNITSVGTLTSLAINGTTTGVSFTANTGVFTGNGNGLSSLVGANVSGAVAFATTANAVAGANVSGAVAFATTANAVAGANVSGAVTYATTANAVAGANVSGFVANATYANLATFATTANAVALANVSGAGNISSINIDGSNTNVLYGNGVFAAVAGGGAAGNAGDIQINVAGNIGADSTLRYVDNGGEMTLYADYLNAPGIFTSDIYAGNGTPSNITLTTNIGNATWTLDTTGNLSLPEGGSIYSEGFTPSGNPGNTITLNPHGSGSITNQKLLVYPTAGDGDHIHLTSGNLYQTELFLGSDNLFVKLANTGNIVINSDDNAGNSAQWKFGIDGNLTASGNLIIAGNTNVFGTVSALIQPTDDKPLLAISSGANGAVSSVWVEDIGNIGTSNIAAVYANPIPGSGIVRIAVGQNGGNTGPNLWDFGTTGILTLPQGSQISETANTSVNITANANPWAFGVDGNLTLPTGGQIIVSGGLVSSGASPAPTINGFSITNSVGISGNGNIAGNNISATGNITSGNISTGVITLTNGAVIKDTAGNAVAFGENAGQTDQSANAVAIGALAGENTQGVNAVAIGALAGEYTQGANAVAVGFGSGYNTQGVSAVAIGQRAAEGGQGDYAVAIGAYAGATNQGNNSIILNATGANLNQTTANTFTVSPVRNDTSNIAEVMFYNATSKEVTYGNTISVAGNVTGGNIIGNGNTLSNVATKTSGSWTLASGVNTVNISVPLNGTYTIWVNGNIPNGIITYTATGVVTNTNVPVLGEQYGWYYEAGNALVLTSIPTQFVGTQGAISNAAPYSGNTANVFTFGITNNSGNTAVVNYGYTKL